MKNKELKGILQSIYEENNKLTPELVVAEARDADHPLHTKFEWDNRKAGEAYRRQQAAELIRSVKISYAKDGKGRDKKVRAFVSYRGPDVPTPTYKPVEEVVQDPLQYKMLLNEMRRDWMTFKEKYQHMEEFHELIAEVDKAS